MLSKRAHKVLYLGSFGFPLAALGLLVGARVGSSITTVFTVHPVERWVLSTGPEGQIISSATDYRNGLSRDVRVVQFERGETTNLRMLPVPGTGAMLAAGDTVALVHSTRLEERFAELQGELRIARAELRAKHAGGKRAVIEEAAKKVEYSGARVTQQRVLFARSQELHAKGFVSRAEYDAAQWQLRQAELEHEINTAQLEVQRTGSKDEELQVIRATINARLEELDVLERQIRDLAIITPVTGTPVCTTSPETLLVIQDNSSLILQFPLRVHQHRRLAEGDSVTIAINGVTGTVHGRLVALAHEAATVNGIQVVYGRILLDHNPCRLIPGLVLGGELRLPQITIMEYIRSLFEY